MFPHDHFGICCEDYAYVCNKPLPLTQIIKITSLWILAQLYFAIACPLHIARIQKHNGIYTFKLFVHVHYIL